MPWLPFINMSRSRNKAPKASSPGAPPTPAVPLSLSGRPCNDPLTLVVERLKPSYRLFADAVLRGESGTTAAEKAGFASATARCQAVRLFRRPDIRQYIHLMQQEAGRAARVSLSTLIDRLHALACDPTIPPKRQDQAMAQLVKLFTLTGTVGLQRQEPVGQPQGLSDDLVGKLEAQLLGVRQQGPEA